MSEEQSAGVRSHGFEFTCQLCKLGKISYYLSVPQSTHWKRTMAIVFPKQHCWLWITHRNIKLDIGQPANSRWLFAPSVYCVTSVTVRNNLFSLTHVLFSQNSKSVCKLPADIPHRPRKVGMSKPEFIDTPRPTVSHFITQPTISISHLSVPNAGKCCIKLRHPSRRLEVIVRSHLTQTFPSS